MAKIIIDVDDNLYTRLFDNGVDNYDDTADMAKAIRKGIPLPKGHGRIADIDKVLEEMRATRTYDIPFILERVKPIIEADKESEDKEGSE